MEEKKTHVLDFRGGISPITMLKMTRIFSEMQPDEILEILGSDPGTRQDVFKVLPRTSYEVVLMDEDNDTEYIFRMQLKKKG